MKKRSEKSFRGSIRYALSGCQRQSRWLLMQMTVRSLLSFVTPFVSVFLTRSIIESITDASDIRRLLFCVSTLSLLLLGMELCVLWLDGRITAHSKAMQRDDRCQVTCRCMEIPYETMLTNSFKHSRSLAYSASGATTERNMACSMALADAGVSLLLGILSIAVYAASLAALHPLLMLLVLLSYGVTYLVNVLYLRKSRDLRGELHPRRMKLVYLTNQMTWHPLAGELRLFGMADWLREKYEEVEGEMLPFTKKNFQHKFMRQLWQWILLFARDSLAYIFLIVSFLQKNLAVSDFVFYMSLVTMLSSLLGKIIGSMEAAYKAHLDLGDLRAFLTPDGEEKKDTAAQPLPEKITSVEFRNLSYHYPGSEREVIRDFNLTLREGERLGLVGLNGVGKTTLILLLCGMLTPTEGQILINGTDSSAFDRDAYRKSFSAVFQDINVLPLTVGENILLDDIPEGDPDGREKLRRCMELAGMENIDPNAKFVRQIHPDAVELSGGEMQKLALARAISKPSKLLILDEPTAALDPLAEQQVYERYSRFAEGKISIFISHRLISTKFCDRIAVLEDGRIAELGSHDELMQKNGSYRRLFDLQSRYYRQQSMEKEVF